MKIYFVLVALCCFSLVHGQDTFFHHVKKEFNGKNVQSTEVNRLNVKSDADTATSNEKTIGDFKITDGKKLSRRKTRKLYRLLSDSASFIQNVTKSCVFIPSHTLSFVRGEEMILYSKVCGQLAMASPDLKQTFSQGTLSATSKVKLESLLGL